MSGQTPPTLLPGQPLPLGAHRHQQVINFSIIARNAQTMILRIYPSVDLNSTYYWDLPLNPAIHRSGDVWHAAIADIPTGIRYAYLINHQPPLPERTGVILNTPLVDPYATAIASSPHWHSETSLSPSSSPFYHPLGLIPPYQPFNWENDISPRTSDNNLIIYEMHVRGFTQHPSSQAQCAGSFLGIVERIDHLKSLGINAIELLPVWEFNEAEYNCCALSSGHHLCNYWGYSPVSFFALMNRYAASQTPGAVVHEFKTFVKAMHQAGIEVLLDVVFNHTAEGGFAGPTYSWKGINPGVYYLSNPQGDYLDYSGCGNTTNSAHPTVIEYIVDSLRYWVTEMHVDGFRFDLASTFYRGPDGQVLDPSPLVSAITLDPILSQCRLIAEPWDARGLYQVGQFYKAGPKRWSEWNGQYRDSVRRFIKGDYGSTGIFATRICGSQDLYGTGGSPLNSINFITAHDGFTLRDLVSYNHKHNFSNGENNRDGLNENESWNCGWEGATKNPAILQLRERQMRNHHLALMISRGIPMVLMGDEYGHTKQGNNNSWCQDNEINWFRWDQLAANPAFFRFFRLAIKLRQQHPALHRAEFMHANEIIWHGDRPNQPNWAPDSRLVAFQLLDKVAGDLFIAFNSSSESVTIHLPIEEWTWVVNTAHPSPEDIYEEGARPMVEGLSILIENQSAIVLHQKGQRT